MGAMGTSLSMKILRLKEIDEVTLALRHIYFNRSNEMAFETEVQPDGV